MQRRSLFIALAASVLVWGFSALEARAGTTLADLIGPPATDFTNGDKVFSNFAYSGPTPPSAAQVAVNPFNLVGPPAEIGLSFVPNPTWRSAANTSNMWTISYDVHSNGGPINDAFLQIKAFVVQGGSVTVTEDISTLGGSSLATLTATTSGASGVIQTVQDAAGFAASQDIHVTKTFDLVADPGPVYLFQVDQGYSQQPVPEPTTVALLGIGMTGLLAFRRFFKRTSVA
jgi:hypothetical protein